MMKYKEKGTLCVQWEGPGLRYQADRKFESLAGGAIKTFDCKGKKVHLKKGQYGYYLNYKKNGKNVNKALPKNIDIDKLDSVDINI